MGKAIYTGVQALLAKLKTPTKVLVVQPEK